MNASMTVTASDSPHTVIAKVNSALRMVAGLEFALSAAETPSEATFTLRAVPAGNDSPQRGSYADRLRRGTIRASMIEAFIELWHKSRSDTRPLVEYLGLTTEEYQAWVSTNDAEALRRSVLSRGPRVSAC